MRIPHTLVIALVLAVTSAAASAADEVIDRVLAVAAGDLIMQSDLRAARELGLVTPLSGDDPDRRVLSQLIDRSLILEEVERYAPPEPTTDAIERSFREVRARFASDEAFNAALSRVGFDETHLRAILRQNLRIRSYLDQRFAGETPERAQVVIAAWVAGLRARSTVVDLYSSPR